MTSEPSEKHQWIELGTVITILVPMFYTAGWSFAYHYFDQFHLGLMGLDIPKEYLFVYSFWAVRDNLLWFLLLLVGVGIFFLGIKFLHKKTQAHTVSDRGAYFQTCLIILIPVAILLAFWLFYSFGDRAGRNAYQEQVKKDFSSYPRVRVWVKPEKERLITKDTAREWEKGCYRLLLRNKKNLYLFYSGGEQDKTPTDIVPVNRTEAVRILPHYHSCNMD